MRSTASIHPVILCGGAGTRLWPASRRSQPKQFVKLMGEQSLFQRAAMLCEGPGFAAPLVVTGDAIRFKVLEQLASIERSASAVLVEPDARNTAPAVLAAALHLASQNPDALMLVLPSDHLIRDPAAFQAAVAAAAPRAQGGALVTFGIKPVRPETGYGYLELADQAALAATSPQPLASFVEKPDAARANAMIATGRYLWNAGIFLMSVRAIIAAFEAIAPAIHTSVKDAMAEAEHAHGFVLLAKRGWMQAPNISIDYAIMEKTSNLAVMPYAESWSDLGNWNSVWLESTADAQGNVLAGEALAMNCSDTLLRSEVPGVALVGLDLENMIVVTTADAVLVAPRASAPRVGDVVARLRQQGAHQAENARRDDRPWGWYESIAVRSGYQVKEIQISPGEALSLQSHKHRAEHWIILKGQARVTVDDDIRDLVEGDYVFIKQGAIHRLENASTAPVLMVEVQTGAYLGEDDIIRYADRYARIRAAEV